jgi:ligand-binding SRPBCC domain-containing protein
MARPKTVVTVIERREILPHPIQNVFAFLDRPSNLKRALPPTLAVSLEKHPGDLRPGSLFHYRLKRWPLDLRWAVVVSEYHPPERFTHVKALGYFPHWALRHELIPRDAGSELVMRLSYEVPNGLYAAMANAYLIREAMEELVSAQIAAVRDALNLAPAASGAASV